MASSLLSSLGASLPVVAAPMAGGPSTPELVVAAARAGGLGLLAGGYQTPTALAAQIGATRGSTDRFGVNLFVPNPVPVDPARFLEYAAALAGLARSYDLDLSDPTPREDDDNWDAKVALLLQDPVPVVSFTFGLVPPEVVTALHEVGSRVVQTVTTADEATAAAAVEVDGMVVQGYLAGAHSGTWTPTTPIAEIALEALVKRVRDAVDLPVWAAGGIATSEQVHAVLAAGAEAAMVGTVLLRSPESGASPTYRRALAETHRNETVLTTAFSGRPARALRNRFVDDFDAVAPRGYPAVHHLTSPLRKAAAAAGDTEHINIWAGAGHAHATEEPAATIVARLGQV